jgi:hypothetical protein
MGKQNSALNPTDHGLTASRVVLASEDMAQFEAFRDRFLRETNPQGPAEQIYRYYRCARYSAFGHPRIRLRESDQDHQILSQFGRMQILDPPMRQWIRAVLRERAQVGQQENRERMESLQRQLVQVKQQKDRLLNIRKALTARNGLFEPDTEWCMSCRHNEKALRPRGQRA